jgi:hypothetical protein
MRKMKVSHLKEWPARRAGGSIKDTSIFFYGPKEDKVICFIYGWRL